MWGKKMEFTDMLKRCNLSEISNYILRNSELSVTNREKDFEKQILKMEVDTGQLLGKYFNNFKKQDELLSIIAKRETVIENVYFQLGLIAGINVICDLERRKSELNFKTDETS